MAGIPAPAPHCLLGDGNKPLGQERLNIPQAEAEYMIQPHSIAANLGGKAMAVVRVGWRLHAASLAVPRAAAGPDYCDNAIGR